MKFDQFWKYLAQRDKDTFIFGSVFALIVGALIAIKAEPLYFVLTGALFIVLYIIMRIALLHVQLTEQEHRFKRSPARKAREILDANATKSEKQALDKLSKPAKTRTK